MSPRVRTRHGEVTAELAWSGSGSRSEITLAVGRTLWYELNKYIIGTFLKKDDPKIIALLQQAELLSSLALKVNTEKTDESYENACKAVQDFLEQTKECDVLGFNVSDMDIRSCDECSQQSWRQPDLYQGSPDSSEYSTGSTVLSQVIDKMEPLQDNVVDGKITIIPESTANQDILVSCDEYHDVDDICPLPISEFNSPLQVTPLFRSMAAGIPSPQFSESVSSFLTRVNVQLCQSRQISNLYHFCP
uniref:Uncharacterized protein n=1 Tax=Helianthus annuus TaxID=4232 RepID=A0A251T6W9_HELAN